MNIVSIPRSPLSCVSRVSVHVSEYSVQNGGSDRQTGTIYTVETLFPDGTWLIAGHYRALAVAKIAARQVAEDRNAELLPDSIWPNRKIGGDA